MKAVALLLGVLLLLGGGAVAGAQFVSMDLSFLDSVAGAKEFLMSQTALYAGGGAAGLGLILFIVGLLPGGRREREEPAPRRAAASRDPFMDEPARPQPRAEPAGAEPPRQQPKSEPRPQQRPEPVREPPRAAPKPVASSAPPQQAPRPAPPSAPSSGTDTPTWMTDPRLTNRKRVSDLVAINDAIKAYYSKHGRYPMAKGMEGFLERGKGWIPGLAPEFIPDLPRDPAQSNDRNGPQYVYSSDGSGYKIIAKGVSLVGGTNVEVLGVRFDPARQNTAENAAFGFWTQGFESANG
jgi:hypothetical protein